MPLKIAWRRLSRNWLFLSIVVLTIGLGIGITTAVFSVVQGVLLRPFPYPEPDELVAVWHTAPGLGLPQLENSDASYLHYREQSKTLDGLAIYFTRNVPMIGGDTPEQVPAAIISASLLDVLRTAPALGRPLNEADMQPGAEPVMLIGTDLWNRRFGGDQGIIDRVFEVDGVSRRVVGVVPTSFDFPDPDTDVYLPALISAATAESGNFSYKGIGRMADGQTSESVQRELAALVRTLPDAFPGELSHEVLAEAQLSSLVYPYREDVVGEVESMLWILLGAMTFVFLLAGVNVANLLLARAEGQRLETAVRTALGSSFGDLVRGFLAESVIISTLGGVLAVGIAIFGVEVLLHLQPQSIPRLHAIRVDLPVLGFTALLIIITTLLLAMIPAFRQRKALNLTSILKEGGRSATTGRARHRAQAALVAFQVALSAVLLLASGLLLRSFVELTRIDPGFDEANVLTFRLSLPESSYQEPEGVVIFYRSLLERLESVPGVDVAGAARSLPLIKGRYSSAQSVEDKPAVPGEPPRVVPYIHTLPGYFEAMEIPILEGRSFQDGDLDASAQPVVVVSRDFAEETWPGESALGKRIQPGDVDEAGADPWFTVVGVAGDVLDRALEKEASPLVYYPPIGRGENDEWIARDMRIVLSTSVPPLSAVDAVRSAVWEKDRNLPLADLSTLEEVVGDARGRASFSALLLAIAALLALLLSSIGLYGTISYLTNLQRHGMAIRLALGAKRNSLMVHVLKRSLLLAGIGVAAGFAGGLLLTQLLSNLLYGVSPTDPLTFIVVPVILLLIAVLAAYIPAQRVTRLDPVIAMRAD